MCTLPSLQPGERELAGSRGGDDLHAADLFHHSGKQAGGRIATSQHQPFLRRFVLREHHQVRAAIRPSGSLDDAVGFRHVVRRGAHRNADPARSDLADAHGLALRRRRGAQHFGGERLGRFLGSLLEAKTARRPSLPARAQDSTQLRYWERRSRLRSRKSSGGSRCTRRARSEAPTPLLFRIWASRFSTRVFTVATSSTEPLRAWSACGPSVLRACPSAPPGGTGPARRTAACRSRYPPAESHCR